MKDSKLGRGVIPAELDPAGIERSLRDMNEAAAQGYGHRSDEAPVTRADEAEVLRRINRQCGTRREDE